jgi:uncharacterized protein YdaL
MRELGRSLTARDAPHERPPLWKSIPGRLIPVAVVAAIAAFVLIPVRQELIPKSAPSLKPLSFQPLPPRPRIPLAATIPAGWSSKARTLILYDHSGDWGWLGELNATLTANLVGHFGPWKAEPVSEYTAGQLHDYAATIYLGTDFNERLPKSFEDDVLRTGHPVIWVADNISELESRAGNFRQRYGWQSSTLDRSAVPEVIYKGMALTRWTHNSDGIMGYAAVDRSRVRVLARAVRADGSSFPWAVRSRNLTYVGEMPFSYLSETDRYLAFADLLFDALAPRTQPRHRAMVMLEDLDPECDPHELLRTGAFLHSQGIPFGFGVSPEFRDPQGHYGPPSAVSLEQEPRVIAALKQLQHDGGVLVEHGYTHQWDGGKNPYDEVTGDDAEFYRIAETPDGHVRDVGPLPEDTSVTWTEQRIVASAHALEAAGFVAPKIFEFPDYTASVRAYRAVALRFPERWERSDYFAGLLTGGPIQYQHVEGQFFPYVVHDVYGTKVLPENLGGIAPSTWHSYKARLPQDVIRAARANLVVRDGFADFYFHPFLKLGYLKRTVMGIKALGYTFVSPASL